MSDQRAPYERPIRAVLHPSDLTGSSELAFVHALRIACAGRTKLYVLHAGGTKDDEVDWTAFPSVRKTLSGWGLLGPASAPSAVAEELGVQLIKIQLKERDAIGGILRFLDDHPSDLIVLTTHGRDGLPRFLHGSIAEPLARQSYTPTLFIPHGAKGFVARESGSIRLRRLLIPIDHRPRPESAVQVAWQLCQLIGDPELGVQLIHVGDADDTPTVELPPGMAADVGTWSRRGDPVEQILEGAVELDADLIVMATAGHQGFLDAIRGSTTERVLRNAPCPVLAVPSP